jgi:hypothetical protein
MSQPLRHVLVCANCYFPHPGFLTESYDELGNKYMVPVYCLSYPINITKETSGRDSPIEVFDLEEGVGGQEIALKLRLSNTCQDVRMKVFTQETVAMIKKRLQVMYLCLSCQPQGCSNTSHMEFNGLSKSQVIKFIEEY